MKINDLSYNATGARYGYNGTHEQDLEVNTDGNYLSFGDFGYDTRVAMRRNQEPMRGYLTSLSQYSIFNSNPIFYKDPTGLFVVSEHIFCDEVANSIINSLELIVVDPTGLKIENSWSYHTYIDIVGAYNKHLHLDNYSNAEMNDLLKNNNFLKLERHALQDFYCHTNYIEIMKELGWTNANMLPFEKLDKTTREKVMAKIRGTNNNTSFPGLGLIWDYLSPFSFNPYKVNQDNHVDDHDKSKLFDEYLKYSDEKTKANWGNSDFFTSKHNGHPNFGLAMGLAIESTTSQVANKNNYRWVTDSPLAPGHYEAVE